MIGHHLEHAFSYTALLAKPAEVIGPVGEGIRANFYVTGGEVSGPALSGRLRPVGADWLTIRRDGVGLLDVRATIELADDALVYMHYQGVTDLGPDGYDKFLAGDAPSRLSLRTTPRFHTAHPRYAWLNRIQALGVGEADLETYAVRYDVYALK